MTRVFLIRHAEAEGNIYRRVHGCYDGLLTLNGREQLKRLSDRFKDIPIDRVYSSTLNRAYETALCVAQPKRLEVIKDQDLCEIALGEWEDLTWGEVIRRYPEEYRLFNGRPWEFTAPGGESGLQAFDRIERAVRAIVRDNKGKNVVIVSHGFVLRALICRLMSLSDSAVDEVCHLDNTSVTTIVFDENERPEVVEAPDNSHLSGGLSTLEKQSWWRRASKDERNIFVRNPDINLCFVPVDIKKDADLIDFFHKEARMGIYGTLLGYSRELALQKIEEMAGFDPRAVVFAVNETGRVGLLELDPYERVYRNVGHISFIYLTPETRGRGLGAQLLGHAVSFYRALGRKKLGLRVAPQNKAGIRFYLKHGFSKIAEEDSVNGKVYVMCMDIAVPVS